jgi:hypothetical protein
MESQLLVQCIIRGDSEGAVKIINSGALDKRTGDEFGHFLFLAARENDTNTMFALFNKGADPNHKESKYTPAAGRTPMHAAAQMRRVEALSMLLEHGAHAEPRSGPGLTPFDLSVSVIEPPGPATDMLISAGSKPRDDSTDKVASAGTQWAMASYAERHGDIFAAIGCYKKAAEWYRRASEAELGSAKFGAFMNSAFMRSFLVVASLGVGVAATSTGGYYDAGGTFSLLDPDLAKTRRGNIATLKEKGERYAGYSKLCSDRAVALAEHPSQ